MKAHLLCIDSWSRCELVLERHWNGELLPFIVLILFPMRWRDNFLASMTWGVNSWRLREGIWYELSVGMVYYRLEVYWRKKCLDIDDLAKERSVISFCWLSFVVSSLLISLFLFISFIPFEDSKAFCLMPFICLAVVLLFYGSVVFDIYKVL